MTTELALARSLLPVIFTAIYRQIFYKGDSISCCLISPRSTSTKICSIMRTALRATFSKEFSGNLISGECCTKCHSRTFEANVLRLCTKDEMQGAEDEVEGSVLTYVTETEFRKQRSRSPSCNSLKKKGDLSTREIPFQIKT